MSKISLNENDFKLDNNEISLISGLTGGGIRQTVLFEGSLKTIGGTATLTDSVLNYDYLYINVNYWTSTSLNTNNSVVVKVSEITFDSTHQIADSLIGKLKGEFASVIEWCFSTTTTINLLGIYSHFQNSDTLQYMQGITKIIGIKFLSMLDYSLEEQNTGRKWIDGKDIYCKTVDFGYFSTTQRYTQIPHNIPLDTCIKIEGTSSIPSVNFYATVAWAQPLEEQPMKAIDFDMDNTKFECVYTLTPDNAQYKAVATFYYTKKVGNE